MTAAGALVGHAREDDSALTAELVDLRPADAKVQTIIGMMIRKEWRPGESSRVLAEQWGCSVALVERYSTEASRFLRLIREPEMVRAKVLARLTEIGDENEGDRVPALLGVAKVVGLLDAKGAAPGGALTPEHEASLEEMLRPQSTPPELAALLTRCWGERTVY